MKIEKLKETKRDLEYKKFLFYIEREIISKFGIKKSDLNNKVEGVKANEI